MKHISILAAVFALSFSSPAYAADIEDEAACQMYSKFAETMVEFMLPLTLQEFVDMMTGKDPDAFAEMSTGMLSKLDGNDIKAMLALGDEASILGEAAGEVAVQMLMSGKATSSGEVRTIMESHCNELGFNQIIANQKKAQQARAGNLTE